MNNQRYAGFWVRFAAVLIDGIILAVVTGIISALLQAILGKDNSSGISSIINLVLEVWYFVYYQAKNGQTLGKKAMNIRVIMPDGQTPSMMAFFMRDVIGKFISGLILGIGYLMMLWDANKQALHDKIAGTYVVYAFPRQQTPASPAQVPPAVTGGADAQQVSQEVPPIVK